MNHRLIGLLLIIISMAVSWAWMDYQSALNNPAAAGKVSIEIEKGDSLTRISQKLIAQHVAIKPFWFKTIAFLGRNHTKIKTGDYELTPGLTLPQILELFVQGKTKQYSITFPEGRNFNELLQEVENNSNLNHLLTGKDFASVMAQLGVDSHYPATVSGIMLPSVSLQSLEGLFFPDTYFFDKHMTDISLLKRAFDNMQAILTEEWLNKSEGLPFKTPYEALILASIVEKETGNKNERPLISGVFIRRLQADMLLQTDPTVIYGMGENYHGGIGYSDLKNATPYNTYVIKGLPPTPIAMPGRDAIHAALHPDDSKNLYFVSRGDGSHVFSATLKEHNAAVNLFQRKNSD